MIALHQGVIGALQGEELLQGLLVVIIIFAFHFLSFENGKSESFLIKQIM